MIKPRGTHVPVAVVAIALAAAATGPTHAQTVPDGARVLLALTGGASIGHETGGTLAGEGTVRIVRGLGVFVTAARLWNITPADMGARAQTIATAVGATATTTLQANVFDAALRARWPATVRVQPYLLAGAGAAQVRTETSFARAGAAAAPGALGIQLGRDLTGTTTKPTLLIGATPPDGPPAEPPSNTAPASSKR